MNEKAIIRVGILTQLRRCLKCSSGLLFILLPFLFLLGMLPGNLFADAIAVTPRNSDPDNHVVKILSDGVSPVSVVLKSEGSNVFFFNESSLFPVRLIIDYGKRKAFCATGDMKMDKDGLLKTSAQGIAPKHFVVACFPEVGQYSYIVKGLKDYPKGFRGRVVVKVEPIGDGTAKEQ